MKNNRFELAKTVEKLKSVEFFEDVFVPVPLSPPSYSKYSILNKIYKIYNSVFYDLIDLEADQDRTHNLRYSVVSTELKLDKSTSEAAKVKIYLTPITA